VIILRMLKTLCDSSCDHDENLLFPDNLAEIFPLKYAEIQTRKTEIRSRRLCIDIYWCMFSAGNTKVYK